MDGTLKYDSLWKAPIESVYSLFLSNIHAKHGIINSQSDVHFGSMTISVFKLSKYQLESRK